jgi:Flp pilus assembly protein TadD
VASGAHEIARLKMDVDGVRAYRLGQFQGALAESRIAMATGTRDARLLAHAGAIELANGDVADGRRDLQAALALGPALDPLTTAEATRLLATS